ncbi:basal-body rod modification protein FlgD [Siccirubricoccus deserti]|uniref:Basal-body rod modification protein FlgD n=1 Tax=Siccirubricoccus deserti TaxID=2013562 RepID=A0A9X0UES8_9PROT|nr:flagellar hook assembly protein FlgD [Siccirubricoccus deserti]MBC4013795.1 flagellar hook assembly protein FlgD [Siccirubricoccus deserti]GGC29516.1 basal-body rod modification protein FlgD [Siccirubricoccus deserti]
MSGTIGSPTSASATGSRAAGATLGKDFSTFLTMLTAQLKNQDPTKAMDTTEMTNQLVAFSQVEQQISMNANLEKLIGLQQASQVTAAQGLLGKTVEVASERLALQGGAAMLVLPPAGAARTATVTVLDGSGRTLRSEVVTLGTGSTEWSWDGRNAAGVQQADGAYRFAVAGRDAAGNPQAVEATVRARITAAERQGSSGDLQLVMGGLSVGFDTVRRIVP